MKCPEENCKRELTCSIHGRDKASVSAGALSDALCDVEVSEEKTLSGWVQPYVSLRIGNFEFKRNYQTMCGAENCVNKIREMLRQKQDA